MTPLLLTEKIKKQLNRTDRLYSLSSITKPILAYVKKIVEKHVFKHCCRHFQDRLANSFRDTGNIFNNKISQLICHPPVHTDFNIRLRKSF